MARRGVDPESGCALPKNVVRPPSSAILDGNEHDARRPDRSVAVAAHPPGESGFLLYNSGEGGIQARVALADVARSSIDAQYYLWAGDTIGRVLMDRIIAAADRGVRVRLLVDRTDESHGQDTAFETGVVITHGTDTMEETAYFLDLVAKSDKPVVLVGSMRPATAVSADGPGNLYNAVAVAASPRARGRGVLVVMNDQIHAARDVEKMNTTNVDTFASPTRGPQGLVHTGKIDWFEPSNKPHTSKTEFTVANVDKLPRVDIIYAHANMPTDLIEASARDGAKGLVIAGVGDGNMTKEAVQALEKAAKEKNVLVVRSTRLPTGVVLRNNEIDDDKEGFVASGELNPAKSRVLTQLALTRTSVPKKIQTMFNTY